MAQTPRKSGRKNAPFTSRPKTAGTAPAIAVTPAWMRLERYEGIADLSTREQYVTAVHNTVKEGQERTESVDGLLYLGAISQRALDTGEIVPRSETKSWKDFAAEASVNESYLRMGRVWFNYSIDGNPATGELSTLDAALAWYKDNDNERAETGFAFVAQQPTGIMLVRDALKGYLEYKKQIDGGKSHGDALDAVDTKFPMTKPETPYRKLTVSKRRYVHEALLIKYLAMMIREDTPDGQNLRRRWPTVQAFMDWSNDHLVTDAEYNFNDNMINQETARWDDVIISFELFPEDDETNEGFFGSDPPDDDNGGGGGTSDDSADTTDTGTDEGTDGDATEDADTGTDEPNGDQNGDQNDSENAPRMQRRRTGPKKEAAPRTEEQKKEDRS
jgi:hypothetical protein